MPPSRAHTAFALGEQRATALALDAEERVLCVAADPRSRDEIAVVTARRVLIVADDGGELKTACWRDFAGRADGDGAATACVARHENHVAALLRRGDGPPEAAFFEVADGGTQLRRVASGRKTGGRQPRWLCAAAAGGRGGVAVSTPRGRQTRATRSGRVPERPFRRHSGEIRGSALATAQVLTRCGALVELSWRGKATGRESRAVPAAVGTDLQVLDAASSTNGAVAAVVRQRSEMHRNAGAFVALLEPAKGRRRRVCEDATLGFGDARVRGPRAEMRAVPSRRAVLAGRGRGAAAGARRRGSPEGD